MNEKELKQIQREAETVYSTHGACPNHPNVVFEKLEPRNFSFNSPFGACPTCLGLGELMRVSEDLIIPDKTKTIMDGAIAIYGKMDFSWRIQQLSAVGQQFGFDMTTPFEKFTQVQRDVLLYGTTDKITAKWSTGATMLNKGWEGIIPQSERLYKGTDSDYRKNHLEKFMTSKPCPTCLGKRLKDTILSVKIQDKSIIDITNLSIENAVLFFDKLEEKLSSKDKIIAKQVLKEIRDRLSFLQNVGLNYLNLSRSAGTLSGGEAQRIRLATQIGSNLMGVLYILDEPSIGLHQRDNEKLIQTLHKLRDIGNSLIVVEHDEDTIREADYVIDIGPRAGIHGGEVCAKGTPKEIEENKDSLTGQYLSGVKSIDIPDSVRVVGNVSEDSSKLLNIGIDIDDVLCDGFEFSDVDANSVLDWDFRNLLGIKPKELKKKVKDNFETNYDKYTIHKDAKKYLKELKRQGHKLFVLTSRPEFTYERTIVWLKKEFGKNFFDEILYTSRVNGGTKGDGAKMLKLDCMIEDSPNAVRSLVASKTLTYLYDRSWNKSVKSDVLVKRVKKWKNIYDDISAKTLNNSFIKLFGASENNLKSVDVSIPTGVLCGITGVSGSGKSTLINQTLVPALKKHFGQVCDKFGAFEKIEIPDCLTNIIVINQDPIGKTPRSNPATYIKVFDEIRSIFADTKESKIRGYKMGRFSFNVKGGRCETCGGDGMIKIEMNFLPDVYVECEDCKGKRYNKDTLDITYKGKTIADVLDMDVEEALAFFDIHPSIKRKLQTLFDVGLGYIKLGQSSTTLSGGESQRIKLTKELAKFKKGHTVYILDEPTTGLHFEDIKKLIGVLNKLVDKGNSVYVIEHNLDVVKSCDYLIDLGPEGGDNGGTVLVAGTPSEVSLCERSYTGAFLKKLL